MPGHHDVPDFMMATDAAVLFLAEARVTSIRQLRIAGSPQNDLDDVSGT